MGKEVKFTGKINIEELIKDVGADAYNETFRRFETAELNVVGEDDIGYEIAEILPRFKHYVPKKYIVVPEQHQPNHQRVGNMGMMGEMEDEDIQNMIGSAMGMIQEIQERAEKYRNVKPDNKEEVGFHKAKEIIERCEEKKYLVIYVVLACNCLMCKESGIKEAELRKKTFTLQEMTEFIAVNMHASTRVVNIKPL